MELPPMSCFSYVTANPSNASIEDRMIFADPGVGCSSYYGYRIAMLCAYGKKINMLIKCNRGVMIMKKKCKKISKK